MRNTESFGHIIGPHVAGTSNDIWQTLAECRLGRGGAAGKMANSEISLEQQEQVLEDNRDFIKRLDADEVIVELIQANLIGQNSAQ